MLSSILRWRGAEVLMSMFVVVNRGSPLVLDVAVEEPPAEVRLFDLEDVSGVLRNRRVVEIDLVWPDVPTQLEEIIRSYLLAALLEGAEIAWFGFEGSFSFDHLLHPDIADQIYGVGVGEAVRLALTEDQRTSEGWRDLLAQLRSHLLSGPPS